MNTGRKVAIVTDSTANLPPELQKEYNIPVIPLKIHWGDQTYIDGVTLEADHFYKVLKARTDLPTTSQPSAGEFIEFFQRVAREQQTDTILGIFISSELSGTLYSAAQAQAELRDKLHIELVDSRFVSMGTGFQVLVAARAARAGADLDEILQRVLMVRAKTRLLFVVDTLEYLHKGGRIGGAARLLGTALNLKPLLAVENGRVDAVEKVRSRKKSLERLLELAEQHLAGRQPAELCVVTTENDEETEALRQAVTQRLRPQRLYTTVLTPAVGTHGGPGTLGITFYTEL